MQVKSTRFGALEIEDQKVIVMAEGMLGFPEKRFVLLTPPKPGPFHWLQSVDNPDLAFVVVDAKNCVPDLKFALTEEEFRSLQFAPDSEVIFLLVVTMAPDPRNITVNLQGPVALNPERMLARQIVLDGASYTTRHPFFPREGKEAAARQG